MKDRNSQQIGAELNVRNHIGKYITFIAIFSAVIVTNWNLRELGITPSHAEEEIIFVEVDKVEMIRADRAASVVQVGNPKIADVNVASAKSILVLGISTGETSLLLLDTTGNVIKNINVVVIPKIELGRVTIHQGPSETKSLDCFTKCVEVGGAKADVAPASPAAP